MDEEEWKDDDSEEDPLAEAIEDLVGQLTPVALADVRAPMLHSDRHSHPR
jgi:hypothetical protein